MSFHRRLVASMSVVALGCDWDGHRRRPGSRRPRMRRWRLTPARVRPSCSQWPMPLPRPAYPWEEARRQLLGGRRPSSFTRRCCANFGLLRDVDARSHEIAEHPDSFPRDPRRPWARRARLLAASLETELRGAKARLLLAGATKQIPAAKSERIQRIGREMASFL
jgi:hypothetical protein